MSGFKNDTLYVMENVTGKQKQFSEASTNVMLFRVTDISWPGDEEDTAEKNNILITHLKNVLSKQEHEELHELWSQRTSNTEANIIITAVEDNIQKLFGQQEEAGFELMRLEWSKLKAKVPEQQEIIDSIRKVTKRLGGMLRPFYEEYYGTNWPQYVQQRVGEQGGISMRHALRNADSDLHDII